MGKTLYLILGAATGAAVGIAVNYLFGPAEHTAFDGSYRSRLDAALQEGERAADLREIELRSGFERGKLKRTQLPDASAGDDTRLS